MKKKFLNNSINLIQKYYPEYDDDKLAELRYGLEGLYLSITKMLFIFIVSYLLNILKETFIMLIMFNVLRASGFGLHATKSWICLCSSTIIFIIFPYISGIIKIPMLCKIAFAIISTILIYRYAPADTEKRPLINKKRRFIYKIVTTVNCIILNVIAIMIANEQVANLIGFGILTEIVLILPITYKLFDLQYENYKYYKLSHD